jgi:hypothetical protein
MKILVLSLLISISLFSLTSCDNNTVGTEGTTGEQTAEVKYACPMHPEVNSNAPGDCNICGMPLELVEKEEDHDHKH